MARQCIVGRVELWTMITQNYYSIVTILRYCCWRIHKQMGKKTKPPLWYNSSALELRSSACFYNAIWLPLVCSIVLSSRNILSRTENNSPWWRCSRLWRNTSVSGAKMIPISVQRLISPDVLFRCAAMGNMSSTPMSFWLTDKNTAEDHLYEVNPRKSINMILDVLMYCNFVMNVFGISQQGHSYDMFQYESEQNSRKAAGAS